MPEENRSNFTDLADRLYELVLVVKGSVSSEDADRIALDILSTSLNVEKAVIKREVWGFRKLAYPIKDFKRGHYLFFGLKADSESIQKLKRKLVKSSDLLRYIVLRVSNMSSEPSAILSQESTSGATTSGRAASRS
ncbi:30S ribosomal protein S6 [Candidatus Sneabacter namystus]|nr:30S ribosomal protein S6 [Candidatus Sneabacter namystus]